MPGPMAGQRTPPMTTIPEPSFPPLLSGHPLDAAEDTFETACRRAAQGSLGAGDVLWSRDLFRVCLAIVLEPEIGMDRAVQMLPLAMAALGDCIGSLTPPQVGLTFIWPDVVCINGAPAGAFRAAAAASEAEEPPAWMVIGFTLRHLRGPADPEPGETPDITWLGEEGGSELAPADIIDSYCRHFLTWLNHWEDDGFKPIHDSWMFRAHHRNADVSLTHKGEHLSGAFLGLDENGNMLLREDGRDIRSLMLGDIFERPEG